MEQKYYYHDGENQAGPVSLDELKKVVKKDYSIWFEGIEWTKAEKLKELLPELHENKATPPLCF